MLPDVAFGLFSGHSLTCGQWSVSQAPGFLTSWFVPSLPSTLKQCQVTNTCRGPDDEWAVTDVVQDKEKLVVGPPKAMVFQEVSERPFSPPPVFVLCEEKGDVRRAAGDTSLLLHAPASPAR